MSVRRAVLVFGAMAWVMAAAACSGSTANQRGVGKNDGIIYIEARVPDAELWVDDRFVGHLQSVRGGVALSPGSHRIEIRHDHYHTHYEVIAVAPRERRTLRVDLAEILP